MGRPCHSLGVMAMTLMAKSRAPDWERVFCRLQSLSSATAAFVRLVERQLMIEA